MKTLVESLKNGELSLIDCPDPALLKNTVIIKSANSVISTGTEKTLLEFGKAGYLKKAINQPEKVKHVLERIKTDGLFQTIENVKSRLDQLIKLGYCNAGIAIESDLPEIKQGDRVISNGSHAEIVRVTKNLCAKIPDDVDDETAAFTVLGSIAMQGIRLLNPTIGETVVVQGLGLVGLLSVQILKANGCKVVGVDYDSYRCGLAKEFGCDIVDLNRGENPVLFTSNISNGIGVDGVLVCTASDNNNIIHQATEMCRKRGRIILVGTAGMNLRREDFFKKELTFQVSTSYGPGRYDQNYEEKGEDYPISHVRWTEQRNFQAVLQLMSDGKINVKSMITHRYEFTNAVEAYNTIMSDESSLGVILDFGKQQLRKKDSHNRTIVLSQKLIKVNDKPSISFIGSGNYADTVLIPAFRKQKVNFKSIASSEGTSGSILGKKFSFQETTTDINSIFNDTDIDALVVTTQHDSHAEFVLRAIKKNIPIFVEKPLCINRNQLNKIENAVNAANQQKLLPLIMVGYNRRFSSHIQKLKQIIEATSSPIAMSMVINAGSISSDHWTQNPKIGGGRLIGEVCHFIDLQRFLVGSPITKYNKVSMQSISPDTMTISLKFENGSIGTIHYFANGNKFIPKERLEIYFDGKVVHLNNFRKLEGFGLPGFKKMTTSRQDKGQLSCVQAFINAIKTGGLMPIPLEEILEVTRVSLDLTENN